MVAFFFPPPGATALSLASVGYGRVAYSGPDANRTLAYSTVLGGVAPVAGNLVVWHCMRLVTDELANSGFQNLTGSGWTQVRYVAGTNDTAAGTILAKVVTAGDISSPPTVLNDGTDSDALFMWTAYAISMQVTLTIPSSNMRFSDVSAPSPITANSTGSPWAITVGMKSGTSGATLGGVTWQNQTNYDGAFIKFLAGMRLDADGANYSVTGGDDGVGNNLLAGYVRVDPAA